MMKQTQIKTLLCALCTITATTLLMLSLYKWVLESVWDNYQTVVYQAHEASDVQVKKEIALLKQLNQSFTASDAHCSAEMLNRMRSTEFQSSWLKDISFIDQGKLLCTTRLSVLEPPLVAEKFIIGDSRTGVYYNPEVPVIYSGDDFRTERAVLVGNFQAFLRIPPTLKGEIPWLGRVAYITDNEKNKHQVSGSLDIADLFFPADSDLKHWYKAGIYYGRRCASKGSCTVATIDIVDYFKYSPQTLLGTAIVLVFINFLAVLYVLNLLKQYMLLCNQLKRGMNARQVICHYQPIMDIESGQFPKVEVLSRWKNEDGEMVRPDIFIGQIEKNQQTFEFTQVVFNKVIDELKQANLWGRVHVAINVYPQDLSAGLIYTMIDNQLTDDEKRFITIEVTEQELEDIDKVAKEIKRLREQGCLVAIDDFGTGYSNFQHLEKLQVDTLKIDKSFVQGIENNSLRSKLTESIVEISKTLCLTTVAEGVEELSQLKVLEKLNVNYSQGFYHARPMPIDALINFNQQQTKK